MAKKKNADALRLRNNSIIQSGLRTSTVNPFSIEGFWHILCWVLAAIYIAAPSMDLPVSPCNYLLLAPELQAASIRQAELLYHLFLACPLAEKLFESLLCLLQCHD
jgi:hypothetical protein